MFGRWFRPSSGTIDCVYSLWYNAPTMLPACSLEAEFLRFQACQLRSSCIRTLMPRTQLLINQSIHDDQYCILHKTITCTYDKFYIQGLCWPLCIHGKIKLEGSSWKSFMFKAWSYSLLLFVTFLSLCQCTHLNLPFLIIIQHISSNNT
jgi:hypothetical protein